MKVSERGQIGIVELLLVLLLGFLGALSIWPYYWPGGFVDFLFLVVLILILGVE